MRETARRRIDRENPLTRSVDGPDHGGGHAICVAAEPVTMIFRNVIASAEIRNAEGFGGMAVDRDLRIAAREGRCGRRNNYYKQYDRDEARDRGCSRKRLFFFD
jgi:hypothetical protein